MWLLIKYEYRWYTAITKFLMSDVIKWFRDNDKKHFKKWYVWRDIIQDFSFLKRCQLFKFETQNNLIFYKYPYISVYTWIYTHTYLKHIKRAHKSTF